MRLSASNSVALLILRRLSPGTKSTDRRNGSGRGESAKSLSAIIFLSEPKKLTELFYANREDVKTLR
jgi:hypothetical protein